MNTEPRKFLMKPINDELLNVVMDKIGPPNIGHGPWIAGGMARKLWFNENWYDHDIDFFFPYAHEFNKVKQRVEKLQALTEVDVPDPILKNFSTVVSHKRLAPSEHITANASSYRIKIGTDDDTNHSIKVQLINRRYYSNLDEIWNDFDFTVCNFVTDGRIILADEKAVEDCNAHLLRMNPGTTRKITAKRVLKYSLYGFNPESQILNTVIDQFDSDTLLNEWAEDVDDYT